MKDERIFNFYKNDLKKLNKLHNQVRFIVIEYVCSFPQICPFKMAAALMKENINVVFDDSSISNSDNAKKERKVKSLLCA